jgi:GT2 family glycosyltransferase
MTLSIIVILYDEFDLVMTCLESIYKDSVADMEIILVDNSIDKEGYKKVLKKFSKIRYIQNKKNIGFGPAVNVGIKHAKGKYILVLTPDTQVVKGTIKQTLAFIQQYPRVGLVGCRIYTSSNKLDRSATHGYPNLLTQLYYYNMPFYKLLRKINKHYHPLLYSKNDYEHKLIIAKYVMGAYMLINKKALVDIGNFDPRFRVYIEDVDLCRRLNENNWQVVYLPVGGLISGDGGAWKKTTITQAKPEYMQSIYNYFLKHHGRLYTFIAWSIGAISAVMSLPWLFGVSMVKQMLNKPSQSRDLIPLWIIIIQWHFTKGLSVLIK